MPGIPNRRLPRARRARGAGGELKASIPTCEGTSDPTEPNAPYALVVDDDGLIRMDATYILEDAGFRTFEACDGDAALGVLAERSTLIVLLFTDVQMPGTRNGFDVARETARRWPHISGVFASGQVQPGPGDMPEGTRFIGKPFTADMVYDHLKEILPDGRKPEPLRRRREDRGGLRGPERNRRGVLLLEGGPLMRPGNFGSRHADRAPRQHPYRPV